MKPTILYGGTGQARVMRPLLKPLGYDVVGIIDDTEGLKSPFPFIQIYQGLEKFLEEASPDGLHYVVTIGNNKTGRNGRIRGDVSRKLEGLGMKPIQAVHRYSFIDEGVRIGRGPQILAGAKLIAGSKIGDYCIVNTNASLDHDSVLGNYSELAPGVTVCGEVTIGESTWIGAGATILPGLRIGNEAMIGAGSVITKNIPDKVTVKGVPGRW